MDNNGNAIIAWKQVRVWGGGWLDNFYRTYLAEYRNGVWTLPSIDEFISPLTSMENSYPPIALMNDNDAMVIWKAGDEGILYKSEYRNGEWLHPASGLDAFNVEAPAYYHVGAMASPGSGFDSIVVWSELEPSIGGSSPYQRLFHAER